MKTMATTNSPDRLKHLLEDRVFSVTLRSSLEQKLKSGKKLVVKLGADPSVPDLHLGHALVLRKLKEFQDLGHQAIFIVGDFTAMIGDPSGRAESRRPLTREEVRKNAKTYLTQVGKILDLKKAKVRYNSEWFSKMDLGKFLPVAAQVSLRRLLDREDFQKRLRAGGEAWLSEGLYQVFQAYDSVAIRADVELGGRDQLLNLLAARDLQKKMGQQPEDVVIMPLLLGTDGVHKMSKSFGNYIGLLDPPEEMFGKVMSIPDERPNVHMIDHYAELAAFLERDDLKTIRQMRKGSPYQAKQFVAKKIVTLYWGREKAGRAHETFLKRFARRGEDREAYTEKKLPKYEYSLLDLVMALNGASSRSEARRLILGRAVEVDNRVRTETGRLVILDRERYIRIGKKKFLKVIPK